MSKSIKVIEITDVHTDPSWIEMTEQQMDRVCEVAIENNVDAILSSGDFFNKGVMATKRNKWDRILNIGRKLQQAAPVFYIEGTKSHDPDGIYESFKDVGWKEITIGKSEKVGNLLILGIPEITPAVLAGRFPNLDKQQLIEKQYELVNQVIDNYYAPLAASHDGPVHFMGHGHVAGVKFRDDQKPRTSDFMFSEEMLARIGADRYQFGHIHLPQTFNSINGGYGGSAHMTWNDLGFKPGFNVVEYCEAGVKNIERFNYGEPERQKITIKELSDLCILDEEIKPEVNLWIDIECDKAFADQFDPSEDLARLTDSHDLGPLSKITTNIQHEEHVRIDTEEYEACKTTEDLYKIYDPNATASILQKVKEAEDATGTNKTTVQHHSFEMVSLYLKGSIAGLENGVEEIEVDFEQFQTGANLLVGPNGTGKSFTLGFCSPFSQHLPTGADLKSLFELKDSQIVRKFRDGEKIITQKILIDPTLASPTAKYYMDIDGKAVDNVTGNKDPFDKAVEDLFGSVKMFMTCAFRGQKENSKYPSLENAKETDLRKIFTELSGIDRSETKQYAHDKAVSLKRDIELDSRESETLKTMLVDVSELKSQIKSNTEKIAEIETDLTDSLSHLEKLTSEISGLEKIQSDNSGIEKQIEELNNEAHCRNGDMTHRLWDLDKLKAKINNASQTRSELKTLQDNQRQHNEASAAYYEAQGQYNRDLEEWKSATDKIDDDLEVIKTAADEIKTLIDTTRQDIREKEGYIKVYRSTIESANDKCEHCGKLSTDAQKKIDKALDMIKECESVIAEKKSRIDACESELNEKRIQYRNIQEKFPKRPEEPESLTELKNKMDSLKKDFSSIPELEKELSGLETAEWEKSELEAQIKSDENRIDENRQKIEKLKVQIKPIDTHKIQDTRTAISNTESDISASTGEKYRLEAENKSLTERIAENVKKLDRIKEIDTVLSVKKKDISEWEKVEAAFSPKGIESLELSLIAPIIDRDANDFLKKYQPRYQTEIITQDYDKNGKGKNLVEKFRILIHDSHASKPKSIVVVSGGQAVWSTSAIRESIAKLYESRTGISYRYRIIDEQDGALDNEIQSQFYSMLNSHLDGKIKLVSISHNTEAKSSISNIIEVTDFFKE